MRFLKEEIYKTIKKDIISCRLKPGAFIRETEFEDSLKVSRTPLREAFNKLEEEGWLKVIPKKGVQVKGLSLMSIAHTYEARLLLEPFILNNYWDCLDINKFNQIEKKIEFLISKHGDRVSDDYIQSFFDLDDQFHRLICNACNNEYLNKVLQHVDDEVERVRRQLGHNSRYLASAQEHLKVINAIKQDNKSAALKGLVVHIKRSQDVALKSISHRNIDYRTF